MLAKSLTGGVDVATNNIHTDKYMYAIERIFLFR